MAQIYAHFIRPSDICFDIGARLGNRLHVWSKLGTEPHPGMMNWLSSPVWLSAEDMASQLQHMPRAGNSGDVYARLLRM